MEGLWSVVRYKKGLIVFLLNALAIELLSNSFIFSHQLYRVSGLGEQIGALEASLDIISATSAARSASGKLEAVVRLSPEEKQQWLQYFDERNMAYTKIADNLAT